MRNATRDNRRGKPVVSMAQARAKRAPRMGLTRLDVKCGECKAEPGNPCVTVLDQPASPAPGTVMAGYHTSRKRLYERERNRLRGL